jgi:hypothetical protein
MTDRWSKLGAASLGALGVLMLFGALSQAMGAIDSCAGSHTWGCALWPLVAGGLLVLAIFHFLLAVGVRKHWGWVVLVSIVGAALGLLVGVVLISDGEWLLQGWMLVAGYGVALAALVKMSWDAYEQSHRAA